jgi:hypothetical protein
MGGVYGNTSASDAYVIRLLSAAKLRHVRGPYLRALTEGWYDRTSYIAHFDNLAAAGIPSAMLTTSDVESVVKETPAVIAAQYGAFRHGTIDALEGPNELNTRDANWAADDNVMVQRLWTLTHGGNASLTGVGTIGPSLANGDYGPLGNDSAYEDYLNIHAYLVGHMPETTGWGGGATWSAGYGYGDIRYWRADARQSCSLCKIVVTETGYSKKQGGGGIPESVEARYIPRLYLWNFINGISRTYPWLIAPVDDSTLGLLRADLTLRPSYKALSGLMNILYDPAAAGSCAYPVRISGTTKDVQAVEFCKTSGEVDLVVWIARQDYDANTNTMAPPASQTVSITPNTPPTRSAFWQYDDTGSWTATTNASLASLTVTSRPSIVVFNGGVVQIPVLPTSP